MKKSVFLFVFLLIFSAPFAECAAYKLPGVYTINGVRKSEIKTISGQYEAYTTTISGADVNHILYGFSGTPDSEAELKSWVDSAISHQMNCLRLSYNPLGEAGTRLWNQSQVQAALDYAPSYFYIIVDRNHYVGEAVDWDEVNSTTFSDVLANWGNNTRVIPEIINEYPNGNYDGTGLYEHIDPILDSIADSGYTNLILCNRHTTTNDTATALAMSTPLDYWGRHSYFDNEDDPANGTQTLGWAQGFSETYMGVIPPLTPLVNTEVGADSDESFNQTQVDTLRTFLIWCRGLDIGNMIWLNHGNNLTPYEVTYDLFNGL